MHSCCSSWSTALPSGFMLDGITRRRIVTRHRSQTCASSCVSSSCAASCASCSSLAAEWMPAFSAIEYGGTALVTVAFVHIDRSMMSAYDSRKEAILSRGVKMGQEDGNGT